MVRSGLAARRPGYGKDLRPVTLRLVFSGGRLGSPIGILSGLAINPRLLVVRYNPMSVHPPRRKRAAPPKPHGRAAKHNPGGQTRSTLPKDVCHRGVFSFCGRYRPLLRRWTTGGGDRFPDRYVAFIGMNPSTADNTASDRTVSRGWNIAGRLGYKAMVQLNVADIRCTHPAALSSVNVPIASGMNLPFILKFALHADLVVACWGELTGNFAEEARRVFRMLRESLPEDKPIYCFGTTKNGWPRHFRALSAEAKQAPLKTHP